MRVGWLACVCLAACGRFGFDATAHVGGDAAPTTAGLIGWWKLDEGSGTVAHDSVGGNDGTVQAGLTWTTGPTGGSALAFPGDGTSVDLDMPAALANLPALTVSALLKPIALQVDGNDNCFFDHGDGTAGWAAGTSLETAGDLSFNAAYTQNTVWQETADAVLAVGVWTRVAVTWDGSLPFASVRFYANDVEVADTDLTDTAQGTRPDDSDVEVVIGCNANHSFDGAISDVRLYDRALTAAEVAAL